MKDNNGLVPYVAGNIRNINYMASYCSINITRNKNGYYCAYWALIDKNPDTQEESYWDGLE